MKIGKNQKPLYLSFFCILLLVLFLMWASFGYASGSGPLRNIKGYSLDSGYIPDYDARPLIKGYAELVHHAYSKTYQETKKLKAALAGFLKQPNKKTMAETRYAWLNARMVYGQTEAFRFYEGPIDLAEVPLFQHEGPESRINPWPLNEAFIDYVEGNPKSGIIQDLSLKISLTTILQQDQVTDETDITTGWHAIEFLLWGQDFTGYGPGQRPASDFLPDSKTNRRRRAYLKIVTGLLVRDLRDLVEAWEPGKKNNYAAKFIKMEPREALGRILTGLASLAALELAGERMSVGLDSGDQENEQSCFSDNTRNDFIANLLGIQNVYFGNFGDYSGPGFDRLIGSLSPPLNQKIIALLSQTGSALFSINVPFDRVLASEKDSDSRQEVERAITNLLSLSQEFRQVGRLLGVKVYGPGE